MHYQVLPFNTETTVFSKTLAKYQRPIPLGSRQPLDDGLVG